VELPTLVSWVKDERVTADTWIYLERSDCWEKASHVPELQMFFHCHPTASRDAFGETAPGSKDDPLCPAALRHIKILGGLNDEQIDRFIKTMQVGTVPAGTRLARQGEPGDAMYLVLSGELRTRTVADGVEVAVRTLGVGEFFGAVSLFDRGRRSADVVTTLQSTLLKIPASEFEKFAYEAPDLAAPFLFALAQSVVTRMSAENRRYRDTRTFTRTLSAG
jgi:CRP-like cAMP-binding protein